MLRLPGRGDADDAGLIAAERLKNASYQIPFAVEKDAM